MTNFNHVVKLAETFYKFSGGIVTPVTEQDSINQAAKYAKAANDLFIGKNYIAHGGVFQNKYHCVTIAFKARKSDRLPITSQEVNKLHLVAKAIANKIMMKDQYFIEEEPQNGWVVIISKLMYPGFKPSRNN
jgi:hypothetical protein